MSRILNWMRMLRNKLEDDSAFRHFARVNREQNSQRRGYNIQWK